MQEKNPIHRLVRLEPHPSFRVIVIVAVLLLFLV